MVGNQAIKKKREYKLIFKLKMHTYIQVFGKILTKMWEGWIFVLSLICNF